MLSIYLMVVIFLKKQSQTFVLKTFNHDYIVKCKLAFVNPRNGLEMQKNTSISLWRRGYMNAVLAGCSIAYLWLRGIKSEREELLPSSHLLLKYDR
jgi:hypothetical protein